MTRGRLIWPFIARIRPLDTAATAADPDTTGPLTSGYDDDFREPIMVPVPTKIVGVSARKEKAAIDLPVQVEDEAWEQLTMMRTGDSPFVQVTLVFHYRDLERAGYIDPTTGDALYPRKNDRLEAIYRMKLGAAGDLVQTIPTPPGLYCTHAQPRSYGLSSLQRNLLVCTFTSRDTSAQEV